MNDAIAEAPFVDQLELHASDYSLRPSRELSVFICMKNEEKPLAEIPEAEESCCDSEKAESCCAPEAKSSCCGPSTGESKKLPTSCGC